jgi:hypothetical protein
MGHAMSCRTSSFGHRLCVRSKQETPINHRLPLSSLPTFAAMALSGLLGAGIATPAYADREPSSEERARIMEALQAAGYSSPEEIELDDGVWEVDDARASDGGEYDLELDPDSLEITSRDRDD